MTHAPLPSDLRDRLDAARDHLHVEVRCIPRGHPDCHGRDFDVHDVRIGADGWQHRPPVVLGPGLRTPTPSPDGPLIVQGGDFVQAVSMALDMAEKRWPI